MFKRNESNNGTDRYQTTIYTLYCLMVRRVKRLRTPQQDVPGDVAWRSVVVVVVDDVVHDIVM